MDLIGWLRSTHAAAAEAAQAALADREPYGEFPTYPDGNSREECQFMQGPGHPSAVLARVEAERLLLADHGQAEGAIPAWPACRRCAEWEEADYDGPPYVNHPCQVWRAIAWGWRHMPGYRDDWQPERTP